ncbi:helix-turn-helix domain-containing protein [Clostridium perfringens]|uniref:Helix-turn-helix transcriptional regulator n=2 Tax=Clostridium perfringens TaxID=1502 RepID=A0A2X2Y3R3_CLOPF|nr:helix-turn-helix transcriptional regulator [Clostridium perfringens]EDT23840.1 cI2009 [Clostridium perfringens B str. ATCC 3626]MDU2658329.1 helix-turn-helix transcriptional regulator [Clostridium perfringens]MDU7548496.1 helix-turn-helix transcriptional regulator [Clostridium perfringens]NGU31863.1 helix-turn-helix transcriptional regulator [Clostridium perfringens]WEV05957.1 helix-turn-helix transcriptional regulator [Clostridium perfringens B]
MDRILEEYLEETIQNIGTNIKRRRLIKGWSLKQLSKKSGVGIKTINDIELGINKPSKNTLYKLSRGFGVTIDKLVYGK